jgi:hypothetical protein
MPPLSVWMLRGALCSLLAGSALGAWLLAGEPLAGATHPAARDAHVTLTLFGWLLPFVLGTAYWMLPRHARGEPRGSRGIIRLSAAAYVAGVAIRLGGTMGVGGTGVSVGTALLLSGTAGFITLFWTRIKPFGAGRGTP